MRRDIFADDLDSEAPTPRRMSVRSPAGQHENSGDTPSRRHLSQSHGAAYGSNNALNAPLIGGPLPLPDVEDWEGGEPDFGADYEPVPENMRDKIGVKIRGLRKEFTRDGNHLTAVEGLDLNLYTGQIFVLLGHNGAGSVHTHTICFVVVRHLSSLPPSLSKLLKLSSQLP